MFLVVPPVFCDVVCCFLKGALVAEGFCDAIRCHFEETLVAEFVAAVNCNTCNTDLRSSLQKVEKADNLPLCLSAFLSFFLACLLAFFPCFILPIHLSFCPSLSLSPSISTLAFPHCRLNVHVDGT